MSSKPYLTIVPNYTRRLENPDDYSLIRRVYSATYKRYLDDYAIETTVGNGKTLADLERIKKHLETTHKDYM